MSKQPHLITVPLPPEQIRELHIEALCTSVRQPIARVLKAVGLKDPLMRGGSWRLTDVPECPTCGTGADPDRPDNTPLLAGAQKVVCVCGCSFDARGLLEVFAPTPEKLDAALDKISVGRPSLTRHYIFDLQTNTPEGEDLPKHRRAVGDNVTEVLRRLEVTGDSVVRGVVVDAIDAVAAQAALRAESDVPWHPKVPLDHRGELMDVGWHNAPLSFPERELQRRHRHAG